VKAQLGADQSDYRLLGVNLGGSIHWLTQRVRVDSRLTGRLDRFMQLEGMTALVTPQIEEIQHLQITPQRRLIDAARFKRRTTTRPTLADFLSPLTTPRRILLSPPRGQHS
jgi:Tfp pilus assembly protein PilN